MTREEHTYSVAALDVLMARGVSYPDAARAVAASIRAQRAHTARVLALTASIGRGHA